MSRSTFTSDLDFWVLCSMFFHFALTILGQTRRVKRNLFVVIMTAISYLFAMGVANYAMGVIPNNSSKGGRTGELRVFWAPFLILHFGGPTSMTVISVFDNELWLRYATHLVTLSYTFGRIFFHNYFLENDLWVATLLVFLAGSIKYIERLCCLFGARLTKFRASTFPRPSPGVNYAKLMLTYSSLRRSNIPAEFRITAAATTAGPVCATLPRQDSDLTKLQITQEAVRLFKAFQGLFVNMPYSYSKREQTRSMFLSLDSYQAFAICEAELKLAYDVFYTKFLLLRNTTIWAVLLNLFVFALQLLSLVIWIRVDKSQFQHGSIKVTHALVFGSIAIDLISLHTLLTSNWVVASLHTNANPGCRTRALLQKLLALSLPSPYPLIYIPQLNFFTAEPIYILGGFRINYVMLTGELREFLFRELQTRSSFAQQPKHVAEICNSRGMWGLDRALGSDHASAFGSWISGVDYEESVMLWHIATTICYQLSISDLEWGRSHDQVFSTIMSNYMFNLLICDTKLMPPSAKFLGQIIFRDTKAEAIMIPLLRSRLGNDWVTAACESVMQVSTELIPPEELLGNDSRSVLLEASVLAKKLEEMGTRKWEVMNKVWAEMLFYAAAQCPSNVYVEKLAQGTELLTTVWLLMAHLGLGKHFRHNKAKETRAHLLVTKLA